MILILTFFSYLATNINIDISAHSQYKIINKIVYSFGAVIEILCAFYTHRSSTQFRC